jgi:hypothetical protein
MFQSFTYLLVANSCIDMSYMSSVGLSTVVLTDGGSDVTSGSVLNAGGDLKKEFIFLCQ